jgi:xanthine dehydrogenase YagS FAD-binding subunit
MANGLIASAALAFGGVAARPWRDAAVERALVGQEPTMETFEAAADILLAEARGQGANDFKIPLLRRTLIAALRDATSGAAR